MSSEIRLAVRVLRRSPAFAFTAIAALALGIGANTAIFSVVNALLLNPPGIAQPDRLLAIRVMYTKLNLASIPMSARDIADVRDSRNVFVNTAGITETDLNYSGSGVPERLHGALVTREWFDVFGARPVLGRVFTAEEDQPEANQVIVLSHAAWQRLFGRDAGVIGRTIELNQKPYRIVGVMPADFRWPRQVDVWAPLGLAADAFAEQNRFNESYTTVERVRDDVPVPQAQAFVGVLTTRVKSSGDRAAQFANDAGWGMFGVPVTDFIAGDTKTPMLILLASVGFVLLIACANIAGLMLARSSSRIREIAIRTALGAQRWDLLRQTLWESLILAFAGALAGLGLAWLALDMLPRLAPERVAQELVVSLDRRVLAFTAVVAVLSGLLFWIAPAWHASAGRRYEVLKEGGRSATAGRGRQRLRAVLVVSEVALALMLLIGAGLLLRSLARLQDVQTGFDARGVMTATLALPPTQYDNPDRRMTFYSTVLDRLSKSSGVTTAAAGVAVPFSGMGGSGSFQIEGRVQGPGDPGPHSDMRYASVSYFSALKIPLRRGRTFTELDRRGTDLVVIIDENLARQYWPSEEPLGKRLRRGRSPWATIVGVVGHVKHSDLAGDTGKGVIYYPLLQQPAPTATFVVRAAGDPDSVVPAIREAVWSIDRTLPLHDIKSMHDAVQASLAPRRFVVTLLLAFAGTALFLAGVGLYGLISYSVAQRTQEIGVRLALGAQRRDVLLLVAGQGLTLAIVGLIIGAIAAFSIGHWLSSQLFEVSAFDPMTAGLTSLVLLATALLASYVPARRASRVDPIVALRDE